MSVRSDAPLAIVGAMQEELAALLAAMPDARPETLAGRQFWRGHLEGRPVVVVLSRIGKVAAATTATVLLAHHGVRAVLFTGVAGGLAEGVAVGDVVVARDLLQHDMDASPLFPRHEVPLTGMTRFPADAALANALAAAAQDVLAELPAHLSAEVQAEFAMTQARLHRGLIVSGDRFVATAAESARLRADLPDALAVEMEGAAVAQVCHDWGVPFAAVRTISDRADDAAHADFGRFVGRVASPFSAAIVRRTLTRL